MMSEKYWRIINQLLTALMLVAALIACQQMPENNNSRSNSMESELKVEDMNFTNS